MRINVIGFGTVGRAQQVLLKKLGHEVFVFDPYVFPDIKTPEKNVDLTFICTPGNVVPKVVGELKEHGVTGLYVIKSTVPVGCANHIAEEFGIHILSNPEFLRENSACEDVLKPDRIIIGRCCNEHAQLLSLLYKALQKPIYITSNTGAEAAKLLSNAYLGMLITFWNEADELITKLQLNSTEVAQLVCSDARISDYGTSKFGHPYGGKCLPMCMDELIATFQGADLNPMLFDAVRTYNSRIKASHGNT